MKEIISSEQILILAGFIFIFSLLIFGFSFTGRATASLNVSISTIVNVNFTTSLVNFGSGQILPGFDNATLDTTGYVAGGNWTPSSNGFLLENIGNSNVSVDLMAGKSAVEFIGGINPKYQYNVTNNRTSSCYVTSGFVLGTWNDINTVPPGTRICDILSPRLNHNSIRIDIRLVVPSDSRKGAQNDVFTVTATAV